MNNTFEKEYYEKAEKNLFTEGQRGRIVEIIKETSPQSMLEVGCGTGDMSSYVPHNTAYIGVDVSKGAIIRAKEKYCGSNRQFRLVRADTVALPFSDNTFDMVVSVYALEHFRYPKLYLKEMTRLLKKGGLLVLLAPNLELPTSLPNGIRHKSIFYKTWFIVLRFFDYIKRLFGVWSFRTIDENFTESTGKYEKADDDLRYVVSSYEVVTFLKRFANMDVIEFGAPSYGAGIVGTVRRIITLLPAMSYYGGVLFVVMKKH